jgi:ferrochelatase
MTYGSPSGPDDMPRYLAAVRGGREASPELVDEFRRRYAAIGGSPLVQITTEQALAVEEELRARGVDASAAAAMRFSEPTIPARLAELVNLGVRHVVGIILSPQHSTMLMGGYERALSEAAAEVAPRPEVAVADAWYRAPAFLDAVADRVRRGLDGMGEAEAARAPVLFTAHSLPRRVAESEPGYLEQLRETATLVAQRLDLPPERWSFCWQSAGHEPGEWMKPDFTDVLPGLRDAGHRSVLVAPIQFLSDHLEILYDVDIGARQQAAEVGLEFRRIESLNLHPGLISALATAAQEAASAHLALRST